MLFDVVLVAKQLVFLHEVTFIRALGTNEFFLNQIVVLYALLVHAIANVPMTGPLFFLDFVQVAEHRLDHFKLRGDHHPIDLLLLVALPALDECNLLFRPILVVHR